MENNRLIKGFNKQINVIRALMYRELKTRVSKSPFGLLGVYIEPLITLIVIVIFVGGIRRGNAVLGMDTFLFITVGIVVWQMFSSIAIRSLNGIKSNRELFNYRYVKPVDVIITRSLLQN